MVEHFLNLAPNGCVLNERHILGLLRLPKYSSELCRKLVQRCFSATINLQAEFEALRPDQATEQDLQDEKCNYGM